MIAERIIEKFTRQQVDIDEMQFGFMPGCGTRNISHKKSFFEDFEKAFNQVPRDVLW